jgi:uncharacterized protein
MAGFVVTIVLLESQALSTWAERLDVSARTELARTEAVAITTAIHKTLAPLGIENLRTTVLADLNLLGWSDDPAGLNSAHELASNHAKPGTCAAPNSPATSPTPTLTKPAAPPHAASIALLPALPSQTPLPQLPAPLNGEARNVALVGDSMMAVGLGNVLLQQSATNPNIHTIKAFRSGTGLARPDVFDWMQEYPAMIANQMGGGHPDVIVVAIGANDGQGVVENGQVFAFGTDAWIKTYQQRTAAFLSLISEHGERVVWVGLPPMKSAKYNEKIALINRIAFTVVSQYPQATWWNPAPLIADDAGNYREFATLANGKTTRIRAVDGIHLSDDGAALLTPSLMHWLNTPAPQAVAQSAPPAKQNSPPSTR